MSKELRQGIIAVFIVLLVLWLIALFGTTTEAHAAVGQTCKSRHYEIDGHAAGAQVWTFWVNANACYWNDGAGVSSFDAGFSGDSTAPYQYQGLFGHWTGGALCSRHRNCTHSNNHQYGIGQKGRIDFCLPPFGCQPVAYPWIELGIDSYGHWIIEHN